MKFAPQTIPAEQPQRTHLTGPAVAELAATSTPAIARLDARWAAQVVAGYAYDAADLLSLLRILGLVDAPPRWVKQ